MKRSVRLLGLAAALVSVLSLSACTGTEAEVAFVFAEDGSFTQEVVVDAGLEDADVDALEDAGWTVDADGGTTISREFESVDGYGDANTVLAQAFMNVLDERYDYRESPDTRSAIGRVTTDYLLFQKHEVELTLPPMEFGPDSCPTCGGDGRVYCDECGGDGFTDEWGYYSSTECWDCSGSGLAYCPECDGTGEPNASDVAAYRDALDDSSLKVTIDMPGLVIPMLGSEREWEFEGDDIEDPGALVATSYVVNWLYTGIALGAVLLLVVIVVWLIVRGVRRAKARRRERRAAKAMAGSVVPARTASKRPSSAAAGGLARFCPQCGGSVALHAKFCGTCGEAIAGVRDAEAGADASVPEATTGEDS